MKIENKELNKSTVLLERAKERGGFLSLPEARNILHKSKEQSREFFKALAAAGIIAYYPNNGRASGVELIEGRCP